jgi:hypothetical protein
MKSPYISKILTAQYPVFSMSKILDRMLEIRNDERISKSLINNHSWYDITEKQYKKFIDNWKGEPLDIVQAHDLFQGMFGGSSLYVYTTESRRVVALIRTTEDGCEYSLALNA